MQNMYNYCIFSTIRNCETTLFFLLRNLGLLSTTKQPHDIVRLSKGLLGSSLAFFFPSVSLSS